MTGPFRYGAISLQKKSTQILNRAYTRVDATHVYRYLDAGLDSDARAAAPLLSIVESLVDRSRTLACRTTGPGRMVPHFPYGAHVRYSRNNLSLWCLEIKVLRSVPYLVPGSH